MNKDQMRYLQMKQGEKTAIDVMNEYIAEGNTTYLMYDGCSPEQKAEFKKNWPARDLLRYFYSVGLGPTFFKRENQRFFNIGKELEGEVIKKMEKQHDLFDIGLLTADGYFYHVGHCFHKDMGLWLSLNGKTIKGAISIMRYNETFFPSEYDKKRLLELYSTEEDEKVEREVFIELTEKQVIGIYNLCTFHNAGMEKSLMDNNCFGFKPETLSKYAEDAPWYEEEVNKCYTTSYRNLITLKSVLGYRIDGKILAESRRNTYHS